MTSSSREQPRHRRARLPRTTAGVSAHCMLLLAWAVVVLQLSSSPAMAQSVSERRINPQHVEQQSGGGMGARGASPLLPTAALGAGRGSIARAARGSQNPEVPGAVTLPTTTAGVRRPEASRQSTSQLLTSRARPIVGTSRGATGRAPSAPRNLIYAPRNNTVDAESGMNNSTTVDSDMAYDDSYDYENATMTDDNMMNTNNTDNNNSTSTADDALSSTLDSGGMMMVSGNITIKSGGITTTVSGVDMMLTVEQMTVDDDHDYVGVMDPLPEDANYDDDDDFMTDNNNNTTLMNSTDNSSSTSSSGDAAFDTVDISTNITDPGISGPDVPPDDSGSSDTTPDDSFSSEEIVMCGNWNSRRALDDGTLEALDAVQKSSGAHITVTKKSGKCECKVAGTDAQVEAALGKVRQILA